MRDDSDAAKAFAPASVAPNPIVCAYMTRT